MSTKVIVIKESESINIDTINSKVILILTDKSNITFFRELLRIVFADGVYDIKKDLIFYNEIDYTFIGVGGVIVGQIDIHLDQEHNNTVEISLLFDKMLDNSNNSQMRSLNRVKIISDIIDE